MPILPALSYALTSTLYLWRAAEYKSELHTYYYHKIRMHIDKNHAEVSKRADAATDRKVRKSRTYNIHNYIIIYVRQRVYWEGGLLSSIWRPLRRRSRDIRIKRYYIIYINIMWMYTHPYNIIYFYRTTAIETKYVYNNNIITL